MLRRIGTAAALIPIVVALVWFAPPLPVAGVALAVVLLALHEFFKLADRMGMRGYRRWTMVCTAGLFYAQWLQGQEVRRAAGVSAELVQQAPNPLASLQVLAIIFVFGAAMIAVISSAPVGDILPSLAVSAAGFVLVAFPFSYLVRILEFPQTGRQFILFTLALVWVGDMLAYFIGKTFGHLPMVVSLSPKKTWEGAAANLAGSLVVAMLFSRWVRLDAPVLLVVAGLANVAGQLGDLLESGYKRGAGTKDSSGLLPGHGGMLDRIDSLILAAPVVWCALVWLSLRGEIILPLGWK